MNPQPLVDPPACNVVIVKPTSSSNSLNHLNYKPIKDNSLLLKDQDSQAFQETKSQEKKFWFRTFSGDSGKWKKEKIKQNLLKHSRSKIIKNSSSFNSLPLKPLYSKKVDRALKGEGSGERSRLLPTQCPPSSSASFLSAISKHSPANSKLVRHGGEEEQPSVPESEAPPFDSSLRRSCSVTLAFPTDREPLPSESSSKFLEGKTASRPGSPVSSKRTSGLHLALPLVPYERPTNPSGWSKEGQPFFGSACQLRGKTLMMTQRGSFLAINQNPQECRESMLSVNYPGYSDEEEEVSLVYTRLEKIPMKDFAAEIRAHLDVEQFLSQAQLMLDVQENDLKQILNEMLHHLMDHEESVSAFQEASRALFTDATAHQLSKSIQCTCSSFGGSYDYDQSWICVLCTAATVQKRHVAIARLRNPANLGRTCQEVWFIIMVVTSTKEKGTKNALETGRTFATLFADIDLRLRLLGAHTEQEFKQIMWEHMKELAEEQCEENSRRKMSTASACRSFKQKGIREKCSLGKGIKDDLQRRMPHYLSDFKDGVVGPNTLHKTVSTTFFLYFACILPAIALGVLNYKNTNGQIDVTKAIYSQTIGGLFFSLVGGQPMVILLTTAPLALYTKVIYTISHDWQLDFLSMFSCTGLWSSFFLLIYALTDASKLMKWCTRSTEEIFAIFISLAFAFDAFKDVVADFQENYNSPSCLLSSSSSSFSSTGLNSTFMSSLFASHSLHSTSSTSQSNEHLISNSDKSNATEDCLRENSLLYLLLMLGTLWLGLSLYNFTKTPFLNASKRELLADCALPVSVILMSIFGSYIFKEVKLKKFQVIDKGELFKLPREMLNLRWSGFIMAMALGFCLSLLFFMDQNTASSIVNSPDNRLKKGPAYHWDLVVIAIINAVLSFLGLPMVHGALPHSPLHVRAMADKEDRVYQGRVHLKIVSVRETRITGILSHILIGLSVHFIDKLQSIPRPVLDGLFLYLAITALHSNQMFERIMLLVTEQAAYPPNHYIRTVPQRKIHLFTFIQLLQLAILCGFGFAPVNYLKMVFPILHLVMLPIRHKIVPHLFERKFLQSLDGH